MIRNFRKAAPRRKYSSLLDPPNMSATEDVLLDATAWLVAISIVFGPQVSDLGYDYQNTGVSDLQDEVKTGAKKGKDEPNGER